MAVEWTVAGFRKVGLDTPEPWNQHPDYNIDQLSLINATAGFRLVAQDYAADLTPSSRSFSVAPGLLVHRGMVASFPGFIDQVAPASATTYYWLDSDGALCAGAAYPADYAYAPLGSIQTDADSIIWINDDDRFPMPMIGGPILVSRVESAVDYVQRSGVNYMRMNAAGGARALTLLAPAVNRKQLLIIRKIDTSANVVTIWPGGATIDGAASLALAAQGSVLITTDLGGTAYEKML